MIVNSVKELCVQHDAELGVARIAWVGGRQMSGFRAAFKELCELVQRLRVGRVLVDLNTLPDISVYDQLWMSKYFIPSVLALPLRQVVMVLTAGRIYNQHVVEDLLGAVSLQIRFDLQFFTQPEAGMHWLTDYSPRLPALLIEWVQHCARTSQADDVAEPRAYYKL